MQQQCELFSFVYGEEAIPYRVLWSPDQAAEKVKIKVYPNAEVLVNAPAQTSPEQIHQAVMKRARWIWQSVTNFQQSRADVIDKHYQSGDMMFYLGRRYLLKVMQTDDKPKVKLNQGQLQVCLPDGEPQRQQQVERLVNRWYRQQAERVFHERIDALMIQADWVTEVPPFKILSMQKQWGSCSIKGCLMLNPHLIKAAKPCIDYVILHELCHLAEYNHSERFWKLLTLVMPNWKVHKARLDGMAELYLKS